MDVSLLIRHRLTELELEQESDELPEFYADLVRRDLGTLWGCLPAGGLKHDPYSYLKSERSATHLAALRYSR